MPTSTEPVHAPKTLVISTPIALLLLALPLAVAVIAFFATQDRERAPEWTAFTLEASSTLTEGWPVGSRGQRADSDDCEVAVALDAADEDHVQVSVERTNAARYIQRVELLFDRSAPETVRIRAVSVDSDGSPSWPVEGLRGRVWSRGSAWPARTDAERSFVCRWELDGRCAESRVDVKGSVSVQAEDRR